MKKIATIFCLFLSANFGFSQSQALNFDGVDDYVPIAGTTKLNSLSKITIETWLYVTNFNSSPCADCAPIIWNQQSSYRFGTGNTQKVYISVLNGSTTVTLTSNKTISANAWHHIAATFSGTRLKLYIDGVVTDSGTYSTFAITYPSTSSDVWIADPKTGFGGTLEETRIWDYARTPAQIQEGTYKRYPSTQPGLVLQFSYEDGTAYADNSSVTKVKDKSAYAHDGVPTNFAMKDSTSNFVLGRSYCDTIAYAKFSVTRCVKYVLPSKKKSILTSGVYQDTISSWRGCDSVMTITIKILKPSAASFSLASCDSVKNPITKSYYKNSGKYTTTIPNYLGCDSVISWFVTVYKKDTTRFSYDACNSVKLKNGNTVTSNGDYVDALKGFRGCDSFVIHTVKIRHTTYAKSTLKLCKFIICPTNKNLIFRKTGVYYDTIQNYVACDSVIEYTVIPASTSSTIIASVCSTYKSPSGKYTWNTSGTFFDTLFLSNSAGCDSMIKVNLTVFNTAKKTLNVSDCRSYTVPSGAQTLTSSGTVTDIIKSYIGCDSIKYTINVTIVHANTAFTRSGNTLTASTTVSGATFQWLDCNKNHEAISGETNASFTPAKDGNFALAVKENNCTDTSACFNFFYNGIRDLQLKGITISPNPAKGFLSIQSAQMLHNARITVLNTLGETLQSWNLDAFTETRFAVNLPAGFNLVRIESKEGFLVKYVLFE